MEKILKGRYLIIGNYHSFLPPNQSCVYFAPGDFNWIRYLVSRSFLQIIQERQWAGLFTRKMIKFESNCGIQQCVNECIHSRSIKFLPAHNYWVI